MLNRPQNRLNPPATGFDLFRLSKSKQAVDVCPNTLRKFIKRGLPAYHQGKAVFVSRAELDHFIRTNLLTQEAA